MRFVKIVVKNFQAIESAEVELGPGLNVVFGPNDLGKSTLACAIRAALLVPPSSTEASSYLPWFVDAVPEVTLTFVDDDSRFWRVRKCFGAASAQATADLYQSKDGISFTRCTMPAREVEDQLRKLLGWGIPSPGGKGAPKKLPTSFLAHVLLAEQTDVDTILKQSTEEDGNSSGRDRLHKALAALAEDPWFKKVLAETQARVDSFFTPQRQRKRGRGSPFALAAEDVRRRAERVEELRKGVADSRVIEEHVQRLREQYRASRETCDEESATLVSLRQQHTRSVARARAEGALAEAQAALNVLDRQAQEVVERAQVVRGLEVTALKAERHLVESRTAVENAEGVLRGAVEALRLAASEDGARQREVARARLGEERADIEARTGKAEKSRGEVEFALKIWHAASAAKDAVGEAQSAVEKARAAEEAARRNFSSAEKDLATTRGVLAYGQWHAADAAGRQAFEAKTKAEEFRAESVRKGDTAADAEAQAAAMDVDAKAHRARLPDEALMRRLEDLAQQVGNAEAALGGGFSLTLRGSGKVPVHITIDGSDVVAGTALEGRLSFDAERTASLQVDGLDVAIVAGAADKRRALESLRERWTNEAQPILERAGLTKLADVRDRMAAAKALETSAASVRAEAKHLRTEAETAQLSAVMSEQRSGELFEQARQAASLQAKLGALDQQALAASFASLGATWQEQCELLLEANETSLVRAREKFQTETRSRDLAAYQLAEAEKNAAIAHRDAEHAREALSLAEHADVVEPTERLHRALAEAGEELAALSLRRTALGEELRALDQEASGVLTAAQAAVEDAKANRERMLEQQARAARSLEEARSAFHIAQGEAEALRKALASVDRPGAETRVAEARSELESYSGEVRVSTEQVQAAVDRESELKATLDQLRAELNQAEGALTRVGGAGLREELAREEEAYARTKERQHDLEVDADAWKLLLETLDTVEKEGSTHLGRSLAAPVSARLIELTRGRYGGLSLDQHLRTEKVDVPLVTIEDDVLEALSVGTRAQIATLIRLTVAEQLKSAIVLDDHLVHTDPERLAWFRDMLRKTALATQVIVLTCRPQDYVMTSELPEGGTIRDLAGGTVRTIDAARIVRRIEPQGQQS